MSILIPVNLEFDLADRIRKALRASDIGVSEAAERLEVNRNTVGNWINGHITPSVQTLYAIAAITGVPFEWLKTGKAPSEDGADEDARAGGSDPRGLRYFVEPPEGIEPSTFSLRVRCSAD